MECVTQINLEIILVLFFFVWLMVRIADAAIGSKDRVKIQKLGSKVKEAMRELK